MRETLDMSHIYYDWTVSPLSRNHSSVNRFIAHVLCARINQGPGDPQGAVKVPALRTLQSGKDGGGDK